MNVLFAATIFIWTCKRFCVIHFWCQLPHCRARKPQQNTGPPLSHWDELKLSEFPFRSRLQNRRKISAIGVRHFCWTAEAVTPRRVNELCMYNIWKTFPTKVILLLWGLNVSFPEQSPQYCSVNLLIISSEGVKRSNQPRSSQTKISVRERGNGCVNTALFTWSDVSMCHTCWQELWSNKKTRSA